MGMVGRIARSNQIVTGIRGPMVGGPAGSGWSYATIAAAESSGDTWAEGAIITITGLSDLKLIYYSALEVDGHSGLIHAFPFGDAVTHSAAAVMFDEAEGVDPDSWSGFTDMGTGTKPTDYDYDVDGGLARLRNITGSGAFRVDATAPTSGQVFTFTVIDSLSVSTGYSAGIAADIFPRAYLDGVSTYQCNINVNKNIDATNWLLSPGGVDTGIPFGTASRVWIYLDDTNAAVWSDTDSSPTVISSGTGGNVGLLLRAAVAGNSTAMKCGYFVNASLTAA
jgi:hypothetical protein